MEHSEWMDFEKQLAVFLGEFDASAQIADDEDRFLTNKEIKHHEAKLEKIWEEHIKNMGKQEHLGLFRTCYSCQHRNTQTDPLMTLGVIRCQNTECNKHKDFSKMFNTIYTKRDIDRAKEHMDEMTRTPETEEEANALMEEVNISGEEMMKNTKVKEKKEKQLEEKEKETNRIMYG